MPQLQLPIFPPGSHLITPEVGFERKEGRVVYYYGHLPVFTHAVEDIAAFRLFTTQLIVNGTASQGDIVRAFGVPLITVKRYVKKFREEGIDAFFAPPPRRTGSKLTPERLVEAQAMLDQSKSVPEISQALGVLPTTLHKAINAGRLRRPKADGDTSGGQDCLPSSGSENAVSTKSERSVADSRGQFGVATGRSFDRLCAALGMLDSAPLHFEASDDVPNGGVLCALPALLELGLLRHTREVFSLPKGFYGIETIFLALAFIALARVRSLEGLRYQAPGEWGHLLGLDRIPEVKTLREKLSLLCDEHGRAQRWSGMLAKGWMAASPGAAGTIYIDGHVRVYSGEKTKLPARYVARQKLCLRGTTDYWANAMDGQPFFVVTQPVDPGLVTVLRQEIVPRLKADVPRQPSTEELERNKHLHRFVLVFDRAGYSPDFFKQMRDERIAILTYHKFPGDPWPVEEFAERPVKLIHGEQVILRLAERGTQLKNGLWLREIRRLDERGHQTSILSTDYVDSLERLSAWMFARWCQENFFKYMLDHFGLDRLIEYGTEPLPESTKVVNPAWRKLDGEVRKQAALLARERAQFGGLLLPEDASAEQVVQHERKKGELLQGIQERERHLEDLKLQRKGAPKHILFKQLEQADRFDQLKADKKHLIDTIKMIAYRAETMLVNLARENLARGEEDARAWVRGLLTSTVDLRPDARAKLLTVRIHRQATAAQDLALEKVCRELNETEVAFPGTELRVVFEPIGSRSEEPLK